MPRAARLCQVCKAELYPDEGRSFCQDCAAVVARIREGPDPGGGRVKSVPDTWTRLLPPDERARREAALALQAERVARELAAGAGR